ncbi:hypothetical protein RRG08_027490 [Elysia crispata]|uniref:Uncharacterized protein n=1 Tax=Elysia crispata TaxID=231223 RepID=A0AAE0YR37_9GAST|nr:hypothetical protein RRG08_027490 [Elysia crispata]
MDYIRIKSFASERDAVEKVHSAGMETITIDMKARHQSSRTTNPLPALPTNLSSTAILPEKLLITGPRAGGRDGQLHQGSQTQSRSDVSTDVNDPGWEEVVGEHPSQASGRENFMSRPNS